LEIEFPSYRPEYAPNARKRPPKKKNWVSRPLNPEAMSFIPGKIMHTRKPLNPLAKTFVPGVMWMEEEPYICSQGYKEKFPSLK
jgi:hypothetical protein